ncbi:MAG: hypothetical protein A2X31_09900 [Elusimicrobia bacterium GWB2_63_22]|nr:MAG: hypothetical protein A2X31_09900 [Elusimicrobia bacterium GWB2_63_22]
MGQSAARAAGPSAQSAKRESSADALRRTLIPVDTALSLAITFSPMPPDKDIRLPFYWPI